MQAKTAMFFAGGRGRGPENEAAYALLFSRSSSVNDMVSLGSCFIPSALADGYCLVTKTTTLFSGNHFFVTKRYFSTNTLSQQTGAF
jgi:hypothetical protein